MQYPEEGALEILTYEQFKRERVPGTDLLRQRVRVSFDFDVVVNDEPIRNSSSEDETKQYDLALLNSFLVADKSRLLHMMMDTIATQLGLNGTETFVATFLGHVDTNSHVLFGPAIDALRGNAGDYWREVREEEDLPWGDVLTLCTEKLFECFSAEFASSSYEFAGE